MEPIIRKHRLPSLVWVIPLLTAVLGVWLVFHTFSERGPLVTITFRTAEGIEVDKTRIKYKSMNIGIVEGLSFSPDFSKVEVRARLNREAEGFLRRDTRFWVVRPTLSARGISGLGTLLSGSYIELEPGAGVPQSNFVGLESPPVVNAEIAGKRITLVAPRLGSIERGSPILHQGLIAGEVMGYELANDTRSVLIHAFVKAPFDGLLRSYTNFWNASGVDVTVNAEGFRVKTESLQSLVFGGIAFDAPDAQDPGNEDIDGVVFTLHEDLKSLRNRGFTRKLKFVLYFDESVRGLTVGAPVEYRGMQVGAVTDVRLEYDERQSSFRIPVQIEIEPERIADRGAQMKRSPQDAFASLIKKGLRARLQASSLLTGQLYVDLDMQPKSPLRLAKATTGMAELPTVRGGNMDQAVASVSSLANKLGQVDFVSIAEEFHGTLKGANAFFNEPALRSAVTELSASLASLRSILKVVDSRAEPLVDNLDAALRAAREALDKARTTMQLVDGVVSPDSPLYHHTVRLEQELTATMRSLRYLIEMLEQNPQSLLFGKPPVTKREQP